MSRTLVLSLVTSAFLVMTAQVAEAQTSPDQNSVIAQTPPVLQPRWEFHVPSGAMVPTTAQRNSIKRGTLTAVQITYLVRPDVAVTSTVGWARSRDIASVGSPRLDVFTYDLGAEVRAPEWKAGKSIAFSPFAGAGAGGRSYNYRHLHVDATHNVSAYVSAGGELGVRSVRLRLEVRDYVTGFKPLGGVGATDTRNDVVVMAGVRFSRR